MSTRTDGSTNSSPRFPARAEAGSVADDLDLSSLALFHSVDLKDLAPLLRDAEVREVVAGEVLIEAGQPNDRLYLLLSGELEVRLQSADSLPIATLGPGETVGELSLIDQRPTSAFVVARTPSLVLVLREATLWAMVNVSHGVSRNLLRTLSSRLRNDHTLIRAHRGQSQQAQRVEALGQLSSSIAHDFNNLLALAMVDLEMIAELARDDPGILMLAEEAHDVLQGGAELTQRLLAFARRQRPKTRAVDVNELAATTGTLLRRSLGERINVRTRLTQERCIACAEPTQLKSALFNLAFNARDAMPDGGTLTLATANLNLTQPDGPSGLPAGAFVAVTVEDTGHGMAPEVLEHAFEPLFTTKAAEAGTGLGLSIVSGFAKQSGGHVTLRSKVGRGTRVTLYLPAAKSNAIPADPSPVRYRVSVSAACTPAPVARDLSARERPTR